MIKSTKNIAMLLLMALMTAVLAACGNDSADGKESNSGEEGLKIAIVTSPSGVDDGNFNEDNYNGILSFIENNPTATVKAVKEETGDPAAAVQAVADIVADYDVIVTPGFQFAGISNIAVENPDKIFILNDSEPTPVDGQTDFENIYAMNFAEQESGFFLWRSCST